ncbi:unnamed protein product [Fraxinus pennsylvanica]|uniref:Uncharacterized protein n=1 Tax=Fraxinus pennsylvanica TaxID=56036 RepID=A0AAD2EB50_9LAMI|nr:unnamed protein product [Fraxinus pennsylvanica]
MSAQLVSAKPVSLSRAAKLLSRFAAVDNGSAGAVPLYLQRTSDAFNHLVQFHSKNKMNESQSYPDMKRVQKLQRDWEKGNPQDTAKRSLDEGNKKYSRIGQGSDETMSEIVTLDGVPEQEKKEKRKRKRKSGGELESDKKEKKNKKRRTEIDNS